MDELRTSESWRVLKSIAQQEGVPGIFYERTYGEHSRVYGFAKVLMLYGDSQVVCASCFETEQYDRRVLDRSFVLCP